MGWPPHGSRWDGIFWNKPISFWQNLKWEKKELKLTFQMVGPKSQKIIYNLMRGIGGQPNALTSFIGNSGKRAISIYRYLKETGKLPNSIILFSNDSLLEVADGFHRLTVLFMLQEDIDEATTMSETQSAWLGSMQ